MAECFVSSPREQMKTVTRGGQGHYSLGGFQLFGGQLQLSRLILRGKDIVRIDFMVFFESRLTPCSAAIQHSKNTSPPPISLKCCSELRTFEVMQAYSLPYGFLLFLFTQCNQVFVDDSGSNVVFEVNCIVLFWKLHM
jgi:hypothetical protein